MPTSKRKADKDVEYTVQLSKCPIIKIVTTNLMEKVIINAKVDPILKKRAQQLAENLDIPPSTVISSALRDFVSNKSITISNPGLVTPKADNIYKDVAVFAVEKGKISTPLIQREFKIGYGRASRILDKLKEQRIIDDDNKVLITKRQIL